MTKFRFTYILYKTKCINFVCLVTLTFDLLSFKRLDSDVVKVTMIKVKALVTRQGRELTSLPL